MRSSFFIGLTMAAASLSFISQVEADFVIFDATTPPAPIVIADRASAAEIQLAGDLSTYLEQITGAKFAVERAPDHQGQRSIVLVIDPQAELGQEASQWTCDDTNLTIRAKSMRGLAYGVYAFLEQRCGCRWWSHNEELVPKASSLRIKGGTIVHQPAFKMHDLFSREAQSDNNQFRFKSGADSQLQFVGGHSLYPLLKDYGKDHPEIYPADKSGKRAPNDLHFCYLAAGISDGLTEALAQEVERRNGNVTDFIYFAGMGDWYGGQCQCDACQAVYEEEAWTNPDGKRIPGYTGTLLRMINRTAEVLEKKYPGIQVGTFAYMSLEAPPALTRPRENVVIRVPRLRHCTVHAANECDGNRDFHHNLMRWQELAPGRVHVWDYGVNFKNFLLPFPSLNSIAANLKLYHELGIGGVMVQGNYVSTGGDAVVLKNYVWRKLLWEPQRSVPELTAEFCHGYYGPAAEDALSYISQLENAVRAPEMKHADEFAAPRSAYLSDALIVSLRETLERALAKTAGADDPAYQRRVRELMVSVEAAELWQPGPLEAQNGNLIRTDLGANTFPRAQELVKFCRNASPTEWGSGRAFQLQFLRMHGGPVALLKSKQLSLSVAPVQGGKIGPILFHDQPLIQETSVQPPGGAILYQWNEPPTEIEISMQGECGISNWGTDAQHLAQVKLKLRGENQVNIAGALRRMNRGEASANTNVTTVYPLAKLPDVIAEWRDVDGKWNVFSLSAQKPSATCIGMTALRIKLTEPNAEVLDTYSRTEKNIDDLLNEGGEKGQVAGHYTEIKFDPKASRLITTVRVSTNNISGTEMTPSLERTLEFTDMK